MYHWTVIFFVGNETEMATSPTSSLLVKGEINLLRYFARRFNLFNANEMTEIHLAQAESLLDSTYCEGKTFFSIFQWNKVLDEALHKIAKNENFRFRRDPNYHGAEMWEHNLPPPPGWDRVNWSAKICPPFPPSLQYNKRASNFKQDKKLLDSFLCALQEFQILIYTTFLFHFSYVGCWKPEQNGFINTGTCVEKFQIFGYW